MKFSEAMDRLKDGAKITRSAWKSDLYFKIEEGKIKSFQAALRAYTYDDDIMLSDGWMVEGDENTYKFYDIVHFLKNGKKAHLKTWNNMHIYFDRQHNSLIFHSMETTSFIPDFSSFLAEDWIEIQ